jgi:hypothetical protein
MTSSLVQIGETVERTIQVAREAAGGQFQLCVDDHPTHETRRVTLGVGPFQRGFL